MAQACRWSSIPGPRTCGRDPEIWTPDLDVDETERRSTTGGTVALDLNEPIR
jgi:hypothetical protein